MKRLERQQRMDREKKNKQDAEDKFKYSTTSINKDDDEDIYSKKRNKKNLQNKITKYGSLLISVVMKLTHPH